MPITMKIAGRKSRSPSVPAGQEEVSKVEEILVVNSASPARRNNPVRIPIMSVPGID